MARCLQGCLQAGSQEAAPAGGGGAWCRRPRKAATWGLVALLLVPLLCTSSVHGAREWDGSTFSLVKVTPVVEV